ncbi:hypothetical protein HGA91_06190 [candidate division WWE3 bacterium]|nr:hypothetical protein [candidate division WWE3 bacterium]
MPPKGTSVGKLLGADPRLSLVGDGVWGAAVMIWAHQKGLSHQMMCQAHSKLCSERIQAWLAHQVGMSVETRYAPQRTRLLSQAIEALIGEMQQRDGIAYAIEKVVEMLKDHLPPTVFMYLSDQQGSSLPSAHLPWHYTEVRITGGMLWRARKGNCVGIGTSLRLAREDAVFQYYFGAYADHLASVAEGEVIRETVDEGSKSVSEPAGRAYHRRKGSHAYQSTRGNGTR